jgi:hypothetical protein
MLILLWYEFSGYEELKSNLLFLPYQDNYGLLLRKQNSALWYHFQMTDTSIKPIHNVKSLLLIRIHSILLIPVPYLKLKFNGSGSGLEDSFTKH